MIGRNKITFNNIILLKENFSIVSDTLPAGWNRNNDRWFVNIASSYAGREKSEVKFVDGSQTNDQFRFPLII